ncbi:MAG: hypothetical protein IJY25_03365 [Bacilli bacterium]|nr:hypothetical protein [Bacilli bacterium]
MEEKDIVKLSRIHEEPTKEKIEEVKSYLEKLQKYQNKIYIERKPQLYSYVSKLPDSIIIEIVSKIEKMEDKKKEVYIGVKEKCSVEELENALRAEIQNRKNNNIQKTSFEPSLEFEEYEIKNSPDFSEIIEIKKK